MTGKKKKSAILGCAFLLGMGCLVLLCHFKNSAINENAEIVKKEAWMNDTTYEVEVLINARNYNSENVQKFADSFSLKDTAAKHLSFKFYSQYDDTKQIQDSNYLLYEIQKNIT